MFRNKKGDMTLNIIIGAAIAMIVLVVLILIFTGQINNMFGKSCQDAGGEWVRTEACGQNSQPNPLCQIQGIFKDDKRGQGFVCCNTRKTGCS